jgi:hypothetical protein
MRAHDRFGFGDHSMNNLVVKLGGCKIDNGVNFLLYKRLKSAHTRIKNYRFIYFVQKT